MKIINNLALFVGVCVYAPSVLSTDFHFHGDIISAVRQVSLSEHLLVLPPVGDIRPIQVDMDVASGTATTILREIGNQAGTKADISFNGISRTVQITYHDDPLPLGRDPVKNDVMVESRRWQHGEGVSPVTGPDGLVLYPYGQTQASLTCSPLHACDIELQPGEEINNVIFGDTVRWISAPAVTGSGDTKVSHVIVKPTEAGLETNLIITTSKRTYMLTVKSSEKSYVSRVGFFYPGEMVQDWQSRTSTKANMAASDNSTDMPMVATDKIAFDYDVDGDKDLPWYPVRVFSDGTHVYIQMPKTMQSSEAPALVLVDTNGNSSLVNYRVRGEYFVIDRQFQKAALIIGTGGDQQKVEITRKDNGLFSWMHG